MSFYYKKLKANPSVPHIWYLRKHPIEKYIQDCSKKFSFIKFLLI